MIRRLATAIAGTAALLGILSGCAQYASVSERRPRFDPPPAREGLIARAQNGIRDALRKQRRDPYAALGRLLAAADDATQKIARDPSDPAAQEAYNFAVARIVRLLGRNGLEPWKNPIVIPAAYGGYTLSTKPDPRPDWNPSLYNFVPADEFDVRGTYVRERSVREGIGAPVVAVGKEDRQNYRDTFSLPRVYYGVTAIIRFDGKRARLSFEDPLAEERVRLAGRNLPLGADFTVPLAVLLAETNPRRFEISRLLNPGRYADTARISRLQPYDPDKTVVLVVHGLMDTPATWTPMINALRSDEDIRKNYQFWFYSYPSGFPYPYSAALLRDQLDAAQKKFRLKKPVTVIGHSMGGCITRLLLTDSGDSLWKGIFRKSPAETKLSPESRALMQKALIFDARQDIGRAIFIASPLRGANMASNPLGRIGSRLIRAPSHLLEAGASALDLVTLDIDELRVRRIPNSIDSLAPNSRFVRVINSIPISSRAPIHVISGDRGRGGNKDGSRPAMSDGIVPYWSSHMTEARSELVVPSNHSAHQNPQAIGEVARILKAAGGG